MMEDLKRTALELDKVTESLTKFIKNADDLNKYKDMMM
jgi:hypothetical protein